MSEYKRKFRKRLIKSDGARELLIIDGALIATYPLPSLFTDHQEVTSEGHAFIRKGEKRDLGGPFLSRRTFINHGGTAINVVQNNGGIERRAEGMVFAFARIREHNSSVLIVPSTNAQLDAYGATLISRALPTNPLSGMGQFLGELREVRKLWQPAVDTWKDRARFFKDRFKNKKFWADNYLNYQFGWVPFVSDICDFGGVVRNLTPHIQQYDRDSGRRVRRRRSFPVTSSVTVSDRGEAYGSPVFSTPLYSTPGRLSRTIENKIERWFSGSFTYYLPPLGDKAHALERSRALANRLYGLQAADRTGAGILDPNLLWKIAPWSWAADWIGNTGDVIHNWQAFQNDGLVMHYGYMMEKSSIVTTYALKDLVYSDGTTLNLQQAFASVTKVRRRATPYGFGLNPVGFTNKQWSIIAALGISKAPRSLRNN